LQQLTSFVITSLLPPVIKGCIWRLWWKCLQTNLWEKTEPEFPRKGVANKEMIDSLRHLVTHRAAFRMRETSACQAICSPAVIMGNKLHKEGALGKSPRFPNFLPRHESSCPPGRNPHKLS
jgi:hypothetical protein